MGRETIEQRFTYDVYDSPENLAPEDRELLDAARAAMQNSYAPYSHFHVGAALRLTDGKVITGCNVESAIYGLTMCAERVAVFAAVAGRVQTNWQPVVIKSIAVIGTGEEFTTSEPVTPCGACRQVIREFIDLSSPPTIISSGMTGPILSFGFDQLLPFSFGPNNLQAQ